MSDGSFRINKERDSAQYECAGNGPGVEFFPKRLEDFRQGASQAPGSIGPGGRGSGGGSGLGGTISPAALSINKAPFWSRAKLYTEILHG